MVDKSAFAVGIYATKEGVESAVEALKLGGYLHSDISVLFPESADAKDAAIKNSKAPENAITGASGGAVLGGALAWLAGIGVFAIPGIGPLIAAGPIVGILTGASLGGALGGLSGAFVGLGIPEQQATKFEGRLKDGGILLSVRCDDSTGSEKAQLIMERSGAEDVSSQGESESAVNAAARLAATTTTIT